MHIFDLPIEVLERILVLIDPTDVSRVSQTSHFFHTLIHLSKESPLWRELYLGERLDDLRKCNPLIKLGSVQGTGKAKDKEEDADSERGRVDKGKGKGATPGASERKKVDWKTEVQRFVWVRNIVKAKKWKEGELEKALSTLISVLSFIRPFTEVQIGKVQEKDRSRTLLTMFDEETFHLGAFIDVLEDLSSSTTSNSEDVQSPVQKLTFAERQLLGKLHTMYGVTPGDTAPARRVRSRASVYDLGGYKPENDYGPYFSNGSVDWERVQALQHVVAMHIIDLGNEDEEVKKLYPPMSLLDIQPVVLPSNLATAEDAGVSEVGLMTLRRVANKEERERMLSDPKYDWAGVGGRWYVSFGFCDHGDLLAFNNGGNIDTSWFEDESFSEAVQHLLPANLVVTGLEPDPDHPNQPIIHFVGDMETPSASTMVGHVQLSTDNQITWHFVSGEEGNVIWSSKGVQIGGVRSAYGVLGVWTTIFHEWDDPVGPLWLRPRA